MKAVKEGESKKCFSCGKEMNAVSGVNKGVEYRAFKCASCGEEIMDMTQARDYMARAAKARRVTFSMWGQAVAVRIPQEVVRAFKIKAKETGTLVTERDGFKIIPQPA